MATPLAADHACFAHEAHEARTARTPCFVLREAELCDGFVVKRQPREKPHHLNATPTLGFQPARRAQLQQIAVDVEREQVRRIVRRVVRRRRYRLAKSKPGKVQSGDKSIDHPADVLRGDKFIGAHSKQRALFLFLRLRLRLRKVCRLRPLVKKHAYPANGSIGVFVDPDLSARKPVIDGFDEACRFSP